MANKPCPYLTNWDSQGRQIRPIEYPSFENHCQGLQDSDTLLLTEQATFCLSGSHHLCPRYQGLVAQATAPMNMRVAPNNQPFIAREEKPADRGVADTQSDSSSHYQTQNHQTATDIPSWGPPNFAEPPASQMGFATSATDDDFFFDEAEEVREQSSGAWYAPGQRWWAWAGALLLFAAVVGMGGFIAAYAGWQLALERIASAQSGEVSTLNSASIQAEQPVQPIYLVLTATSVASPDNNMASESVAQNPAPIVVQPRTGQGNKPDPVYGTAAVNTQSDQQPNYPVAVTATPVVVVPLPTIAGEAVLDNNAPTATPATIQLPPAAVEPTSVPVIDVQVAVPTRRPTPEFDIPTSTPAPLEPTPTNTLAPLLGPPVVIFDADESAVPPGECTKVRWHVENVREVYYESQPAFGDGDKTECLEDERDTFALTVMFGDGQTKIYTTSVDIVWPTPTPSITPSFTPDIPPTPTWTPEPPTATPTPNVVYGVTLATTGDNPAQCVAGTTCSVGLLATNTGDTIDTIAIELVAKGSWSALVCSQVGTCSADRLVVANVGPSNTVFVDLQATVPAGVNGQNSQYTLRAISDGSGGTIVSSNVEVTIIAQN